MSIGLVNEKEASLLKAHIKSAGGHASMPSFMLLQWSMVLYRTKCARLNELEKTYWAIRRCQDDVVEMMELPMPFQYFHIMNLMMMLNLTLWSYSLALEDSYFASLIFVFVQLVFQGIRELSVALADPYGDDEADFPLDEWMTQLYIRLGEIIEDPYDAKHHSSDGLDGTLEPLRKVSKGRNVIELMVDQTDHYTPQRNSMAQMKKGSKHSLEASEDEPPPKAKVSDTKGDYQALPQKPEEEEEEEDDDGD